MDYDAVMSKVIILEQKIDSHIEANTERLDHLIALTQQITTVNERQSRNQDDIIDLRNRITTLDINTRESATRLHGRIDQAKEASASTDRELNKWLNRGLGAWFLLVIVAGIFQWLANDTLIQIRHATTDQMANNKKIEVRVNELEAMVTSLMATANKSSSRP